MKIRPKTKKQNRASFVLSDEDMVQAKIPKAFWEMGEETYPGSRDALKQLKHYLAKAEDAFGDGVGLMFRGEPDSGKTFLLSYALRYLMCMGFKVYYITLQELTDMLFKEPEILALKFADVHFAAIDAVGLPNEGKVAALERFVRVRKDNALPFLLGTTLLHNSSTGEDDFQRHYKETGVQIKRLCIPVKCSIPENEREYREQKRKSPYIIEYNI